MKLRGKTVQTESKCWESNLKVSTDHKCPHIEDPKTEILVPYEVWQQIISLTKSIDTEWLGYLGASKLQDGRWQVVDVRVPKQEVSSAAVKPTETFHSEGVVHSHVGMGAFFSSTDDNYLNENHHFSIVVNNRGDSKAIIRHKLPCGSMTIIEAQVEVVIPDAPDVTRFVEEAKKNISEKTYTNVYTQNWKNYRNQNIDKAWDADVDDNTKGKGVPDYTPKKHKNRKEYEYWDISGDYEYWSNWAQFAD